ncbi:MAG TPA: CAP domain-containing protein [Candidatus Limnocylindria bacterium]|nr:CAP domain-containing protein [Candidatus Limnocylindria bacterium]
MSATAITSSRRVVARTLGLGISALLTAGLLAWTPTAVSGWNQGSAEATLWQLMNGARVNNGIAPVQSNGTLVALARWRSADMLQSNYFSHTIPSCGCLVYTFYDRNGLSYDWAGENIGWNSGLDDAYSPVRVHEAFMASAGHRANVLDARFTHGGVGAAAADGQMFQGYVQNTRMYTELFMQARYSAPAPAPAPQQPAPAPRPPSGGGSGGGGGGGGATAPRTTTALRPAATPQPTPKIVSMAAPRRPSSAAGIDGVAQVVNARPPSVAALVTRFTVDELDRPATGRWTAAAPARDGKDAASAALTRVPLQVAAAPVDDGGFGGFLGAIIGFLFG